MDAVSGHGGFGITYRSIDEDLEQVVAIKEYLPRRHMAFETGIRLLAPEEVGAGPDQEEVAADFTHGTEARRVYYAEAAPISNI